MTDQDLFYPQSIFSSEETDPPCVPRVLIAPHRYIQGKGVFDHIGRYLAFISGKRAAVLIIADGPAQIGQQVINSLQGAGVYSVTVPFKGECCPEEVERVIAILKREDAPVDCLIAVGGGKCLDTGKNVAHRLSIPVVICPTIASTDAPCSAVSVMYTKNGVIRGPEFYPNSPNIVVVDTGVIARAPVRHLIAGMADALATCYEVRTCFQNPAARSMVGSRITVAAAAISEACAKTVFEHGLAAAQAVRQTEVNEALEQVVEANTLLSGIGFESGGLAAAHAVAGGLTEIARVHKNFLHGELVAIGILSHLVLEGDQNEAERVARFLARLGLPVHLGHFSLDPDKDSAALNQAMEAGIATSPFIHNEPFEITAEKLLTALLQAHELGLRVTASAGDTAYRELHSS